MATVLEAKDHPKADRLLVLEIDLGGEQRQIVAGIRGQYEAADLTGAQIIVVANLEPAVIRGVESQGMLLAADDGGGPVLVRPDKQVAPGSVVK